MYNTFSKIAHDVAIALNAPEAGVAVTVDYSPESGYTYAIWAIVNGKIMSHSLDCLSTNAERLTAHVAGFIKNIQPKV